jgi:hypothetical protein
VIYILLGMIIAGLGLTIGSLILGARRPVSSLTRTRTGRFLAWLALGSALLASTFYLVVPTYTSVTFSEVSSGVPPGVPTSVETHQTLLQVNGPSVLLPLAVPVLMAAVPLVFAARRWSGAITAAMAMLLSAFVLITGFSIGIAYFPSAMLLLGAAGFGLLAARSA